MEFFINGKKEVGKIKEKPEDFIVEEITKNGEVLKLNQKFEKTDENGDFTVFVLQKKLWDTYQALLKISKYLNRGKKAFSFAGTKDRRAITTQLASFYKVEKEKLLSIKIKDIQINGAWKSKESVKLGELLGNRFEIFVKVQKYNEEYFEEFKKICKIPNYFGPQRFGARKNNFDIGIKLLKKDFESAVLEFLCSTKNEKNKEAREAREKLKKELDFKKALEYFPKFLRYERRMLSFLSSNQRDFIGAFRVLPRSLKLMFIHSVQAQIFNEVLEKKVKDNALENEKRRCKPNFYGFPDLQSIDNNGEFPVGNLVGYESVLDSYEEEVLNKYSLSKEDFHLKEFPEISQKGGTRALVVPVKEFGFKKENEGVKLNFSLPEGSYATILLMQFFEILNDF
jgi:tRNA pseudouridine13 synthase